MAPKILFWEWIVKVEIDPVEIDPVKGDLLVYDNENLPFSISLSFSFTRIRSFRME